MAAFIMPGGDDMASTLLKNAYMKNTKPNKFMLELPNSQPDTQSPMAAAAPEPSWQDKLTAYSKDPAAGKADYLRSSQLFNARSATGDAEGANAASKWMGQIQTATGGMAAPDPNAELKQYLQTYRENATKPITPFAYDPNTDPSYQAQKSNIHEDLRQAMANARVDAGAVGMRGGSLQNNQLSQLTTRSESRLQNETLPAAMARAYQQYQDKQTQGRQQNQDLLGFISAQAGLNQTEVTNQRTALQDAFNNNLNTRQDARAEGQMTGSYMPPGAKESISAILNLKRQAEQDGVSPEQMAQFKTAADAERSKLFKMGVDPNVVGFDSNYDQAAQSAANYRGIQTLPGQQQELANTQLMAQLTGKMPDGTPTTAEQQRLLANEWKFADSQGVIGEKLGELYNLPPNTPTQAAKAQAAQIAISQQNANTSASSAANSAANSSRSASNAEARLAWDKDPNNPDNIYKTSQSNKNSNAVDPKVSADNYSFYMSQIDGKNKGQAEAYIQSQSGNLSDQDYRDLIKYVREKL